MIALVDECSSTLGTVSSLCRKLVAAAPCNAEMVLQEPYYSSPLVQG